ncbi:MAG: hypothetical protein GWO24_06880 [Akkermansiaceae bacterium]|nr:hypothetical protein [Akkermansiaceae bacterium]
MFRGEAGSSGSSSLGARQVGRVWALCNVEDRLREVVLCLLEEWGFANADEAFERLDGIPRIRLHCRHLPYDDCHAEALWPKRDPLGFLRAALILAKCCGRLYDPLRPIILTEKRLMQRLELFEIRESFYDDDQ